ncbi:MAG: acetyltransferase [Boseongicola sp. SB0677_bin_26]|nr:acetyltransferase [Boseongicola sp. SB0665_bin_10]MYG25472.1 acetyltransferase [Boseongicola sp. SB0677_bin_26]
MMATNRYTFRKAAAADLGLLRKWQSRPHVREWWDSDEPGNEEELADPRIVRWIVSTVGRPFAYMQDYTVHGWEDHHFFGLPEGSRGIDQFIGDPDMIGKGHGSAFITERLTTLYEESAPVVAVDPHPDNARATAAYRRAGFAEFGPPRETRWGPILPMKVGR